MEFRDQKLSSTQRKSGLQPNQARASSPAISSTDHKPMTSDATLLVTAISQEEISIGASPMRRPGRISREIQATTSLGRLISTNMLPASESRERRFVLDASSSISPKRGSMIEFRSALARLGLFLDHWDTASSKVIKPHTGRQRSAALLAHMYRRGIGNAIDLKEAYAWSEVAAVEGNSTERQARDQLLYSLTFDDQGEALRR